jgi:hypothetical protein
MTAHSTIITTMNPQAVIELALRFGWIKPAGCGLKPQPPATMPFGRIVSRRETRIAGGKTMPTNEFLGSTKHRRWADKVLACGGVCDEYVAECESLGIRGSWVISTWKGVNPFGWETSRYQHLLLVEYALSTYSGIWRVSVRSVLPPTPDRYTDGHCKSHAESMLRNLGVQHWTCCNPMSAHKVLEHLVEVLGPSR